MSEYIIFDNLPIGRKFKTISKITYVKNSSVLAKPILSEKGIKIDNGKITSMFYKSNIQLEQIT